VKIRGLLLLLSCVLAASSCRSSSLPSGTCLIAPVQVPTLERLGAMDGQQGQLYRYQGLYRSQYVGSWLDTDSDESVSAALSRESGYCAELSEECRPEFIMRCVPPERLRGKYAEICRVDLLVRFLGERQGSSCFSGRVRIEHVLSIQELHP
jgi:hypothetical protein